MNPGFEIHQEEFLRPLELTAANLAKPLRMPSGSVESLACSERPITTYDPPRLLHYFDTIPGLNCANSPPSRA